MKTRGCEKNVLRMSKMKKKKKKLLAYKHTYTHIKDEGKYLNSIFLSIILYCYTCLERQMAIC